VIRRRIHDFYRKGVALSCEYLDPDEQAIPQHEIEKAPEHIRKVLWKPVSQCKPKWRRELLARDSVRKVSEGIGEQDPAEKAHDIGGPIARGSRLTVIMTFALHETEAEPDQQDSKSNRDER
jgi:hypothetical protein